VTASNEERFVISNCLMACWDIYTRLLEGLSTFFIDVDFLKSGFMVLAQGT